MKSTKTFVLAVVLIAGALVAFSTVFAVHQTQQALILQLGNPIRVIQTPGLNFKIPFIQNVQFFDNRVLDMDPPAQEVILSDQKRIDVDSFLRYRIVDPLEFRKSAQTDANFQSVFGQRLNSNVRSEFGKIALSEILTDKRIGLMDRITKTMRSNAPTFGIEVVDVRIGRTDLPKETADSVYNRMRSDRVAAAADIRAKGEEQRTRIRATADRVRTVILAEADKKSEILRGEGDGLRTNILNDAYGQDRDFFNFYRSLDALGNSIQDGTSMVLSPNSDLFRFLDNVLPKKGTAGQ
ncbi:MAG: protease modulator HflC [Rhodospirillales bacterium]